MAKKGLILVIFALFSLIFIGSVFSITANSTLSEKEEASFLSWLVIAYVAGLSMIVLPCTLPLVFIIVPLTLNKSAKQGLGMSLLFGAGITITITIYGALIALIGESTSLDQISTWMFLVAGVVAFVFGLSQLKIISLNIPSYSGTPTFIQNRGDYSKSFFIGLLLGNAGVGCPNPLFYWLLIYIAGTGSIEIGTSLGMVHGIGRAIPLILLATLAIVGINATKSLTHKKIPIENATGWMLIIIGSFLIVNGLPEGHEWYEETFVHKGWNDLVKITPIPSEFHVDEHTHGHHEKESGSSKQLIPLFLLLLIVSPVAPYLIRRSQNEV